MVGPAGWTTSLPSRNCCPRFSGDHIQTQPFRLRLTRVVPLGKLGSACSDFLNMFPVQTAGRSFLSTECKTLARDPLYALGSDVHRHHPRSNRHGLKLRSSNFGPGTPTSRPQARLSPAPTAKPGSLHPLVPYSLSQSQQRLVEQPPCLPHNESGERAPAPAAPKPRTSHLSRSRRVARIRAIPPPRHRPPVAPRSSGKKRAGSLAAFQLRQKGGFEPLCLTTCSVARNGWREGGRRSRALAASSRPCAGSRTAGARVYSPVHGCPRCPLRPPPPLPSPPPSSCAPHLFCPSIVQTAATAGGESEEGGRRRRRWGVSHHD